jgi:hypothetical protein
MQGLIFLVLAILPTAGFLVGAAMARNRGPAALPRRDQKELIMRRNFDAELTIKASEHATLGEPFAIIVLNMLQQQRNRLP